MKWPFFGSWKLSSILHGNVHKFLGSVRQRSQTYFIFWIDHIFSDPKGSPVGSLTSAFLRLFYLLRHTLVVRQFMASIFRNSKLPYELWRSLSCIKNQTKRNLIFFLEASPANMEWQPNKLSCRWKFHYNNNIQCYPFHHPRYEKRQGEAKSLWDSEWLGQWKLQLTRSVISNEHQLFGCGGIAN